MSVYQKHIRKTGWLLAALMIWLIAVRPMYVSASEPSEEPPIVTADGTVPEEPPIVTADGAVPVLHLVSAAYDCNEITVTAADDPACAGFLSAVWSDANGQDDLVWYEMQPGSDGRWCVSVPLAGHGCAADRYEIHVYGKTAGGTLVFIGADAVEAAPVFGGTVQIVDKDTKNGSFTLRLTDAVAPREIASVLVPVWSTAGGQDDLRWERAVSDGSGWTLTVRGADHGMEAGTYMAHIYYEDSAGGLTFVTAVREEITYHEGYSGSVFASETVTDGKLDVQIFDRGTEPVLLAAWCEKNGQDDLKWYNAPAASGGVCTVKVDLAAHGFETGTYQFHAYRVTGTGLELIAGTSRKLDRLWDAVLSVDPAGDGMLRIHADRVRIPVSGGSLSAAVWTTADGQDDLVWYPLTQDVPASDSASGWSAVIDMGRHGMASGKYAVHLYGFDAQGKAVFVCQTTASVTLDTDTGTAPALFIRDVDAQGKLCAWLLHAGSDVSGVKFAVWTKGNGQDDLTWYTGVKDGAGWRMDGTVRDHRCESDTYIIHTYTQQGGALHFCTAASRAIESPIFRDGGLTNQVAATSWVLFDRHADEILYAREPDGTVQLASQTKLMTAILVLENCPNLNAHVTMTQSALDAMTWDTSKAGLEVGKSYTVRMLLEGLLVYSGGDCANLLAEYIAGSVPDFVDLMNIRAVQFGMTGTLFSDPIGLYDNHSTPREYMKLACYADNFPIIHSIVTMPYVTMKDTEGNEGWTLKNTNNLINGSVSYDRNAYTVDGLKTGFTEEAGYCLTATAYNARARVIAAVFGSTGTKQRAIDCRTLLDSVLR